MADNGSIKAASMATIRDLDRKWDESIKQDREQRDSFQTIVLDQIHDFDAFAVVIGHHAVEELDIEWRDLLMKKTLQLLIEMHPEQESMKTVATAMLKTLCQDEEPTDASATMKSAQWKITLEAYDEAASIYQQLASSDVENESKHSFHALFCHFLFAAVSMETGSLAALEAIIAKCKEEKGGNDHQVQFIEQCVESVGSNDFNRLMDVLYQYDEEHGLEPWVGSQLLNLRSRLQPG